MDVENELKALRYLVNDLILYIYDLRIKLEEISPSKRRYILKGAPNDTGDSIRFDLFNIKKNKYEDLINQYGIDVINRACVKLDEFIRINSYIPYKVPSLSLQKKFIPEVLGDIEKENIELYSISKLKLEEKIEDVKAQSS